MDEKLLEVLVCPVCKGPLVYKKELQELWSRGEKLAYKIEDGIPVMLVEQARKLTLEELDG
tara:strand:+ start:314 stop:496 length:183 start_codon:yes stop_codon:yes gene_type:complete